jgi:hypothetical protein
MTLRLSRILHFEYCKALVARIERQWRMEASGIRRSCRRSYGKKSERSWKRDRSISWCGRRGACIFCPAGEAARVIKLPVAMKVTAGGKSIATLNAGRVEESRLDRALLRAVAGANHRRKFPEIWSRSAGI